MRHPQISLTILINTYDDGLYRPGLRFIPALGPSDVQEHQSYYAGGSACNRALKRIRLSLSVGISCHEAWPLQNIVKATAQLLKAGKLPQFVSWQLGRLLVLENLPHLLRTMEAWAGHLISLIALGNLLFAGCYLEQGHDFNRAGCILRVTKPVATCCSTLRRREPFLVAEKENGTVLLNEADMLPRRTLQNQ